MHTVIAEIFTHCTAGIRRYILHRSRVGSRCRNYDGIIHCTVVFEGFDHLSHGRTFLSDGNIYAVKFILFRLCLFVNFFLINNGIKNDCGLSGLAVSDNQFALPAADRNKRVHDFQSGLHRFMNRAPRNNAGSFHFRAAELFGLHRSQAVNRLAQRVNNASEKFFANRHAHNLVGTFYHIAFFDLLVRTKDNHADIVFFKVKGHSLDPAFKLDQLTGLNLVQTVNAGDTVTDGEHLPYLGNIRRDIGVSYFIFDNGRYFTG